MELRKITEKDFGTICDILGSYSIKVSQVKVQVGVLYVELKQSHGFISGFVLKDIADVAGDCFAVCADDNRISLMFYRDPMAESFIIPESCPDDANKS